MLVRASSSGGVLRRLLEVLFDGKPEAEEMLKVGAAHRKAAIAKARERLVVPADPAAVAKLALRYTSSAFGEMKVLREATRPSSTSASGRAPSRRGRTTMGRYRSSPSIRPSTDSSSSSRTRMGSAG
jgi:hypothetical protein